MQTRDSNDVCYMRKHSPFALDSHFEELVLGKLLGWKPVSSLAPPLLCIIRLYKAFLACSRGHPFYALERLGSIALLLLDSSTDGRFEEATGIFGRYASFLYFRASGASGACFESRRVGALNEMSCNLNDEKQGSDHMDHTSSSHRFSSNVSPPNDRTDS